MKRILIIALFLLTPPLFAQDTSTSSEANDILSVMKDFWMDFNLGNFEKLPALGRPEDLQFIPSFKKEGEAAGMMKMKDMPQLSGLRQEISQEVTKAFIFSKPTIAQNGKSAEVTITTVVSEARSLRELKMIYDVYMGAAYDATQSGKEMPTLESIKAQVLAPDSPAQKRIDEKTAELEKMKMPPFLLENTPSGWKINMQNVFGK